MDNHEASSKTVGVDVILRDRSLTDLYVHDAMDRQASHGLMRSLVSSMEDLVPQPLEKSTLPDTVLVAPLKDRHLSRAHDGNGKLLINDARDASSSYVFPPEFDIYAMLVSNHTIDRGSVGLGCLHFMEHKLLTTCYPGFCHDLYNSIKNAAKAMPTGQWWSRILEFGSIANLNHGPYRSNAWRRDKEELLCTWKANHDIRSSEFRTVAERTAALEGHTLCDDADYVPYYHYICSLPSCTECGPILKFARFLSIEDAWLYYRKEMWCLKSVLEENDDAVSGAHARDTTSMLDAENQDVAEPTKKKACFHVRPHTSHKS